MADFRPDLSLHNKGGAGQRGCRAELSPLYRQIKALLIQSLDRGEWKPGALIPSEIDLAARFQVSQGTVRKAVDELAAEHLLLRRQGKGTFVATHHEARVRYRFLRLASDEGDHDGESADSRILACQRVRASVEIARGLALRPGAYVLEIHRLLSFGNIPTVLDNIALPGSVFRSLTFEQLSTSKVPLYGLLESEFGISMIRADEKLRAVAASAEIAAVLKVAPGAPLLQVDRISYTYGDRPMEMRRGLYMTDRYHYRNSLN